MRVNPADLVSLVRSLHSETLQGFSWLAGGLASDTPVTFVPNPGNIGDAAINLACWRFLADRFVSVEICPVGRKPSCAHVFVGGGGNLVEGLYRVMADFIDVLPEATRLYLFPSTVQGNGERLAARAASIRVVCRDEVSHRHLLRLLPPEHMLLGHDAAFALGPWLRAAFADRVHRLPDAVAKPFRRDGERAISENGGLDIMYQYQSGWSDPARAEQAVRLAAGYLLGFRRVETDRLHCAILSAILGRETVLRPNSYFKNAAVFARSLSRFANVEFDARLDRDAAQEREAT